MFANYLKIALGNLLNHKLYSAINVLGLASCLLIGLFVRYEFDYCSGAIALCIAWATVGGSAVKAASAKPVLALRYE